jgi:hypothetical protein
MLLFHINGLELIDASISESKPLSVGSTVVLFSPKPRPLVSLRVLCFQLTARYFECELLIMGVQQLKDTFSMTCMNSRAWLSILGLEANNIDVVHCNSRQHNSGGGLL